MIHEARESAVVSGPLTPTDTEYLQGYVPGVYFMLTEAGALTYLKRRRDRRFTHLLTVELGLDAEAVLDLRDDYDALCRWSRAQPRPTLYPTCDTYRDYCDAHGKLGFIWSEGRGPGWDQLLVYPHFQGPMTVLHTEPLPPELAQSARARAAMAKARG